MSTTTAPLSLGVGKDIWDEAKIRLVLTNLSKADKTKQWICSDLTVVDSSKAGRCFWKVIGKHFQCLRSLFYDVDVDASSRLLQRLKAKIPDGTEMADLFDKALGNFENITRRRLELPGRLFAQVNPQQPQTTAASGSSNGATTTAPIQPVVVGDADPDCCCTCYPVVVDNRPWYMRTFYRSYQRPIIAMPIFRPFPLPRPMPNVVIRPPEARVRQVPGADRASRSSSWIGGGVGSGSRVSSSRPSIDRSGSVGYGSRSGVGSGSAVYSRGIASSGLRVVPGSGRHR